jgi:hypothetical protein
MYGYMESGHLVATGMIIAKVIGRHVHADIECMYRDIGQEAGVSIIGYRATGSELSLLNFQTRIIAGFFIGSFDTVLISIFFAGKTVRRKGRGEDFYLNVFPAIGFF